MINYSQKKFRNFINDGIISFFGYSYAKLPEIVLNSKCKRINIFFKNNHKNKLKHLNSHSYFGYKAVSYGEGEVVFLDQDAVKSLCIGYPSSAKLVLVSLRSPKLYIFILIGILRRLLIRSIKIKGFIRLNINSKKIPWIIIENHPVKRNSFNFSSKIGIKGLLNYLKKEKINYLVPRFYNNLPYLNSQNDDLDLLVENKDFDKLNQFLKSNPGSICIDVYTDIGLDFHGLSYFPPFKAREILARSIDGPSNSRIPDNYDSLLLLIYHVLYHKGFLSGLQSVLIKKERNLIDNKYYIEINKLKKDLNIRLGNTLEELDDFMFQKGWRPAVDTLTKIAEWNEWVNLYHNQKNISKTPLYVLIIKNKCVTTNKEKALIKECEIQKLKILEQRNLTGSFKANAIRDIRGGIWNDSLGVKMKESDYHPVKIYVIWDRIRSRVGGFSNVKEMLRKKIDENGPSLIHSSDNYLESLDYIKVCMPDKLSFYQDERHINLEFSKYDYKRIKLGQIIQKMNSSIGSILVKILGH